MKVGTLIKQCLTHDTRYYNIMLPQYCLYGKFTNANYKNLPWYMPKFPYNESKHFTVYIFTHGKWDKPHGRQFMKLYKDIIFYIMENDIWNTETIPFDTVKGTFQSGYPYGRKQTAVCFSDANKKWASRGDGGGKMSYDGSMLFDTVYNRNTGELEYNFTGKKRPIVYNQSYTRG